MKAEFPYFQPAPPVAAVSGACHAVGSDYQDGKLSGGLGRGGCLPSGWGG